MTGDAPVEESGAEQGEGCAGERSAREAVERERTTSERPAEAVHLDVVELLEESVRYIISPRALTEVKPHTRRQTKR